MHKKNNIALIINIPKTIMDETKRNYEVHTLKAIDSNFIFLCLHEEQNFISLKFISKDYHEAFYDSTRDRDR